MHFRLFPRDNVIAAFLYYGMFIWILAGFSIKGGVWHAQNGWDDGICFFVWFLFASRLPIHRGDLDVVGLIAF